MIKNKNDRIKSALGQRREGIYCPVGLQRSLSEKVTLLSCILNPNALCSLPCSYCLSTWHHPSPWRLQWLPNRFSHFALPTIYSLLNRAASVRLLRSRWDDATCLVKTLPCLPALLRVEAKVCMMVHGAPRISQRPSSLTVSPRSTPLSSLLHHTGCCIILHSPWGHSGSKPWLIPWSGPCSWHSHTV